MLEDNNGAGVKFPPPLVFVLAIAAGVALNYLMPLAITHTAVEILQSIGGFILLLCTLLIAISLIQFRRAKTSIEPWKPTSHIISSGVFGITRNPIYLAFVGIDLAVALLLNNVWMLITLAPAIWLIKTFVIDREERYLSEKFTDEYTQYCAKVRRWL